MPSLTEKDARFLKMKLINALLVLTTLHLLFVSKDIQEALKQLYSKIVGGVPHGWLNCHYKFR